jgi:Ser/Thr protein kinase RdoA (MazF antagonist)
MPRGGGASFAKEELARVLSHYELGIIQCIDRLIVGNRRAAKLIIVSERGRFLLKRRPKGSDDTQRVALAHSVQMYLVRSGLPVPLLISRRDEDNTVLSLEGHIYELFEYIDGARYDGSSQATTDAGKQLARLHIELAGFSSNWKPPQGSFHDSANVRIHLRTLASQKAGSESKIKLRQTGEELTTLYNASSTRVNELGFDSWPEQLVHGDWHPGNMLFKDGKVRAILDFDSIKLSQSVTDLANGMLQISIVGGRPNPADWPAYLDQAKLVQFLSGYRQLQSIEENRLNSLPDLMIETMIAEAVLPIAATGFFGNLSGLEFLKMIKRKCQWIDQNRETLTKAIHD